MNRKEFVIFWAEFVKSHDDKEWSRQQKILIDSRIFSAREFLMRKIVEEFRGEV